MLNIAKQYLMVRKKRERNKTYSFREGMPEEVYDIIIKEQNKIREERRVTQYSMEKTIYHIIKEFSKLKYGNI